jgi:hypothetical protein
VLSQETTQRIDAGGTGGHPLVANPMERQQFLLRDGFHGHWLEAITAHGVKQAGRIGAVALLASDEGSHVLWGKERDAVASSLSSSRPKVRSATRLHHDVRRGLGTKKSLELGSRETMAHGSAPGRARHGHFKDTLRKVNRNRGASHDV